MKKKEYIVPQTGEIISEPDYIEDGVWWWEGKDENGECWYIEMSPEITKPKPNSAWNRILLVLGLLR